MSRLTCLSLRWPFCRRRLRVSVTFAPGRAERSVWATPAADHRAARGGLAALAVPFVQSLWPLALLWVFEAAAFAAATPAEEALVVDISGGERQGTALGYYTAAAALGGVIGPLLGGWLYGRFAAVGAFGTSALLMVLGAVFILVFMREPSHSKATTS